jgi:hypothetical protein
VFHFLWRAACWLQLSVACRALTVRLGQLSTTALLILAMGALQAAHGGISLIDVNLPCDVLHPNHRLDTPIWPGAGASVPQRSDEKCRSESSA